MLITEQYDINFYFHFHCIYSYYTVVAPGTIKSNRKYTVAVGLHEASEPGAIQVSIEGPSLNASRNVYLQPFETKHIDFMPHKLLDGVYILKAEGISGLTFKNETTLSIESWKGPKIYIQTDKAVYKPKDLVQFRVIILDEHTRPIKIKEPIHIEILVSRFNLKNNFCLSPQEIPSQNGFFKIEDHIFFFTFLFLLSAYCTAVIMQYAGMNI